MLNRVTRIITAVFLLVAALTLASCAIAPASQPSSAPDSIKPEQLTEKTWVADVELMGDNHEVSLVFSEGGKGTATVDSLNYDFTYSIDGRKVHGSTTDGEYDITATLSDDGTQLKATYIISIVFTAQ